MSANPEKRACLVHVLGSEMTIIFESVLKKNSTLIKSYLLMFPRGDLAVEAG